MIEENEDEAVEQEEDDPEIQKGDEEGDIAVSGGGGRPGAKAGDKPKKATDEEKDEAMFRECVYVCVRCFLSSFVCHFSLPLPAALPQKMGFRYWTVQRESYTL